MDRIRLLKEGAGCGAHDDVVYASLPVIGLHCDITDVIAAARQGSRDKHVAWR